MPDSRKPTKYIYIERVYRYILYAFGYLEFRLNDSHSVDGKLFLKVSLTKLFQTETIAYGEDNCKLTPWTLVAVLRINLH